MQPTLLQRVVYTILTYLNAGSYYKTAEEIKNAFNIASLQLYKKLRGNLAQYVPGRPMGAVNFGQTNVTMDSLAEMYRVYYYTEMPLEIKSPDNRMVDVIEVIEAQYNTSSDPYYPVMVVPDNQYGMILNNPIIPPIQRRPLGRLIGYDNNVLKYEIAPSANVVSIMVRCLTLPTVVDFDFTIDTTKPLPIVVPIVDTDWTEDKYDQLVFMTVEQLGFNISNGVLIQAGQAQEQKVL
jgi:hypothetical protein